MQHENTNKKQKTKNNIELKNMWRGSSTGWMPSQIEGQDASRPGFARGLTKEDLALDPERALMVGNAHDNIAAAIVDAEEEMAAERIEERQSKESNDAGRKGRDFWDLGASYVHPEDVVRDASVGPGAFSWPEPDIVARTASQDTFRSHASAAYTFTNPQLNKMQPSTRKECADCGSVLRCACSARKEGKSKTVRTSVDSSVANVLDCPWCSFSTVLAPAYAQHVQAHVYALPSRNENHNKNAHENAQKKAQQQTMPPMTNPADDEATHFSTSFYAPGKQLELVSAMRAASVHARKGKPAAGGYGRVASRAMRTTKPLLGAAHAFDQPRTGSTEEALKQREMEDAMVYGSARPHYDVAAAQHGQLGVANRYGLRKLPGTVRTTHELMRRDAEVQGIRLDSNAYADANADAVLKPFQGALGFRFVDRPQFHFDTPKFFPARDPADKLLYEAAASVAPDIAADASDFAALRGFEPDRMIEPLDARYEMMCEIERNATHERDPYMIPRTGPSVQHAGNARPPAWYIQPGN